LKRRSFHGLKPFFCEILQDLQAIPISFEVDVADGENSFRGCVFSLLNNALFECSGKAGRGQGGKVKILLHSYITEAYFRGEHCLSTKLLQPHEELKTEIARMLYDYLDRVLAGVKKYEKVLSDLIPELGLSEEGYGWKSERKKLFLKPVKELCGLPLSTGKKLSVEISETRDKSDWKLVAVAVDEDNE